MKVTELHTLHNIPVLSLYSGREKQLSQYSSNIGWIKYGLPILNISLSEMLYTRNIANSRGAFNSHIIIRLVVTRGLALIV